MLTGNGFLTFDGWMMSSWCRVSHSYCLGHTLLHSRLILGSRDSTIALWRFSENPAESITCSHVPWVKQLPIPYPAIAPVLVKPINTVEKIRGLAFNYKNKVWRDEGDFQCPYVKEGIFKEMIRSGSVDDFAQLQPLHVGHSHFPAGTYLSSWFQCFQVDTLLVAFRSAFGA